jgi:hypothetical protein
VAVAKVAETPREMLYKEGRWLMETLKMGALGDGTCTSGAIILIVG